MFEQILDSFHNIITNLFSFLIYIFSHIRGSFDFWVAMFAVYLIYKMLLQPFFGSAGSDRAKKSSRKKNGNDGGKG